MAGTIRKVTSNTLTYSQDFSSLLSHDGSDSASLFSEEMDNPEEVEFDLREGTISMIGNDELLSDAPALMSEAVIPLEAPPSAPTNSHESLIPPLVDIQPTADPPAPPPVAPRTSRAHKSAVRGTRTLKSAVSLPGIKPASRRNLSQHVDELVGSPISTKGVSKPKGDNSPIFPISRTGRQQSAPIPRQVVPSPRVEKILQEDSVFRPFEPVVIAPESKKQTPVLRPISVEWKCPDAWIPNHRCDAFCLETLRSF